MHENERSIHPKPFNLVHTTSKKAKSINKIKTYNMSISHMTIQLHSFHSIKPNYINLFKKEKKNSFRNISRNERRTNSGEECHQTQTSSTRFTNIVENYRQFRGHGCRLI